MDVPSEPKFHQIVTLISEKEEERMSLNVSKGLSSAKANKHLLQEFSQPLTADSGISRRGEIYR